MISRYSRPQMAWIWEDKHKYLNWLKVEAAVCEQLALDGVIPREDWEELSRRIRVLIKKGGVNPEVVDQHEAITRHDLIAFTTAVADEIGPLSRYIHYGLTSSDVVDTALSLQIKEAGMLIQETVSKLNLTLKSLAEKYQELPTIGRSHGIFAEPTSFGLKFLGWYAEGLRNSRRLDQALENIRFGKLSGAVGVTPHWSTSFEEKTLAHLGLKVETVSTQVVPRDRHAELLSVFAILGSSLERIAIELRHLQRSEVSELREGFQKGQKGSSAMPHKRNPISSENITGCARLLRSYSQAAFENIALWHERDISHSSVERVIIPDSFLILDYALHRMNSVLESLNVQADQVAHNLKAAGKTVFSGHYLLELIKTGATREQAYAWVQECALGSIENKKDFVETVSVHPEIKTRLSEQRIRELGSLKYQLRNVDDIYRRALTLHGDGD